MKNAQPKMIIALRTMIISFEKVKDIMNANQSSRRSTKLVYVLILLCLLVSNSGSVQIVQAAVSDTTRFSVASEAIPHNNKAIESTVSITKNFNPAMIVENGVNNIWTSIGPEGGPIKALAIDPNTTSTLYAGSFWGGVFKSTDGGGSWRVTGLTLGISALAIDPTMGTLYAAGGNGKDAGVYKSTDGGMTWSGGGSPVGGDTLAIDPVTPSILYIGTSSSGVFKSTNSGGSWSAINAGLTDSYILSILIDPSSPTTLYAETANSGVFKSTNGGTNWSTANTGLSSSNIQVIAIDPATPSTLYAVTGDGVFKSTNGGGGWSVINTSLTASFIDALAIDPITPSTIYAGSTGGVPGVFKSTDGGASWSAINLGPNNWVWALAINPTTPSTLYAGTNNATGVSGVFKSTNSGENWNVVNTGLTNSNVNALAIDPSTPTTLYAGTDGGLFKSTNSGGNWGATGIFYPVYGLAIDKTTPSTLYAGTMGLGMFKSMNAGLSWSAMNTGLTNRGIYVLEIDPVTPSTLYAGTNGGGVFKSTNGGGSWSAVNAGLTDLYVLTLTLDPSMPTTLYAGTYGGVFKSTNSGGSWSAVNTGLTDTNGNALGINTLAVDPATPSTLYAGTSSSGVFKSTNGGNSWSAVNVGLPTVPFISFVDALAIDPSTPSTLYAGTRWDGVFKSTNGGGSWSAINTGLTQTQVLTLAINPVMPSTLYAGTLGGSAFVISLSENTFSISGKVTISGLGGLAGVTISDGIGHTVTTDSSGNYTITVSNGWSGTVTPSKNGYTFSPTTRTYSNVLANQTGQDYTAKMPVIDYFALGDSIASGHGLGDDLSACRRSVVRGYPWLVRNELLKRYTTVNFQLDHWLACSGATAMRPDNQTLKQDSNKWLENQVTYAITHLIPDHPTLVTITIGSNDFGWANLANFLSHLYVQNGDTYTRWVDGVIGDEKSGTELIVRAQVARLLAYNNVSVVITGIHNPFNQTSLLFALPSRISAIPIGNDCGLWEFACYTRTEYAVTKLNGAMIDIAFKTNLPSRLRFAPVELKFQLDGGHESPSPNCGASLPTSAQTWVQYPGDPNSNSLDNLPDWILKRLPVKIGGDCVHPNDNGAAAYADAVNTAAILVGR